jgi:hypothetical protein
VPRARGVRVDVRARLALVPGTVAIGRGTGRAARSVFGGP